MVNVIGFDVGGVNTKAAYVETDRGSVVSLRTASEYFPVWRRSLDQLPGMLGGLLGQLKGASRLDGVGFTMTAELSDAYRTKREGVHHILDSMEEILDDVPGFVLDVYAELRTVEAARREPLAVAAANWAATGWMVSQRMRDCIIVDIGSTSTSIIPVVDGEIAARGRNDMEKLMNGELVYTGSLRTNIAAIVNSITLRGGQARVSSELFAQSGDIHLILGNIGEGDYTVDTADGREGTRAEAMARLARVICADIEMLGEQEIVDIAKQVYDEQVEQVAGGLKQVYAGLKPRLKREPPVVVTGLGREFLAKAAAQRAGFKEIVDLGDAMGDDAALVSPAVGVALITASRIEGRTVRWMQR
ncbi:H4MPT-linked C1 transfer pathway protein [Candidatus Bathyarchaeota archaeon]|nr:H4MPT-linked C1 transfer pathway protein [Candidatus Bathyarchaeota archaeon]MBL7080503.1 H4MPT-linked C1 transfer pathway protein [Candidatus Bathyarchaeota archaeon]